MKKIQDKDTRYFIEIELSSLKIVKCSFDYKDNLNKGRQNDPAIHRLFITRGQYTKFVDRCSNEPGKEIET